MDFLKKLRLKFNWWQLLIYETGMVCLGLAIGIYWFDFFKNFLIPIIIIAIICISYLVATMLKQLDKPD